MSVADAPYVPPYRLSVATNFHAGEKKKSNKTTHLGQDIQKMCISM